MNSGQMVFLLLETLKRFLLSVAFVIGLFLVFVWCWSVWNAMANKHTFSERFRGERVYVNP